VINDTLVRLLNEQSEYIALWSPEQMLSIHHPLYAVDGIKMAYNGGRMIHWYNYISGYFRPWMSSRLETANECYRLISIITNSTKSLELQLHVMEEDDDLLT
jgi:hypothetical protein